MKNESGKSIVILVIMTIFIAIGAAVIINYAKGVMAEKKVQDLRTNMLFIQAEAKKGLEEVCFRTVNLDEAKEENKAKINEIKQEHLEGTIVSNSPVEVQEAVKNIPNLEINESYYYLDEETLEKMGIENINTNEFGYFIVKYDFETTGVEVLNTNGYNGIYTLTQLNELIDGKPIEEQQKEGEPLS